MDNEDSFFIDELMTKNEADLISFIDNNKNFNYNLKSITGNYLIFNLILKDYYQAFQKLIFSSNNIELDLLDNNYKSIVYYIISLNRTDFLNLIINNINKFVGFPILELKDKDNNFSLSYCILFNNFKAFKKIYDLNQVNILEKSQNGDSLLHLAIKNKNKEVINFLLQNNFPLNQINNNNENIAHYFINFYPDYDTEIYQQLDLQLKENNFNLSPLHLLAINQPTIIQKLNLTNYNLNITDYYGNSPIFYLLTEGHYNIFLLIIDKYFDKIDFNLININGDTLLHLYLKKNLVFDDNISVKLIDQTNLNLQDNDGMTLIHYFITKNISLKLLEKNKFNIFIPNNNNKTPYDLIKDKKSLLNITAKSIEYYVKNNQITNSDISKCLKKNSCQEYFYNYMLKNKSMPVFIQDEYKDIKLDSNLPVINCQYAGISLDILFGLVFIKNNTNFNIILEHPLISNKNLVEYFKTLGVDLEYREDFINIQIYWAYQKLILPSFLNDNYIKNLKNKNNITIIPLGIEIEEGGHANILIIDHNKKIIERFEPYGANSPKDFYYNGDKLDSLLKKTFSELNYQYKKPSDYLPPIGLQYLESMETTTCNLGDPNGFCAVWCVWWVFHKYNNNLDSKNLINKLIHKIKLQNYSFKNIIRNFSGKITSLRDEYLDMVNLDINQWIQGKYDLKTINNIINNLNIL